MRIKAVPSNEQVYNESDEGYREWLETQDVDFINLEKLLKDEGLIEEFGSINPFFSENDYSDISDKRISNFRIEHNRKIKKGVYGIFTHKPPYADDYKIKGIIIYSKEYNLSVINNFLFFKSDELKTLVKESSVSPPKTKTPGTYKYDTSFKRIICIDNNTKISDISTAIQDILKLTDFIDSCIERIEAPDRRIIAEEYIKAKNNT